MFWAYFFSFFPFLAIRVSCVFFIHLIWRKKTRHEEEEEERKKYLFDQNWLTDTIQRDKAKLSESSICGEEYINFLSSFYLMCIFVFFSSFFCRKLYFVHNNSSWLTFVDHHRCRAIIHLALAIITATIIIIIIIHKKEIRNFFPLYLWVLLFFNSISFLLRCYCPWKEYFVNNSSSFYVYSIKMGRN